MKQFFVENWKLILEICCAIAALVFMLVRKKPIKVIDSVLNVIDRLLPGLLNLAEIKFGSGNGSDKLAYVLQVLKDELKALGYGDEVYATYLPYVREQVEVILSTPQKKGVVYEKTHVK